MFLSLGENDLRGPLPPEIGAFRRLQGLDLSYNYLSGTREGDRPPVAIVRDSRTGEVRAILRRLPSGSSDYAAVAAAASEPGLEVLVSTGLPAAPQWR